MISSETVSDNIFKILKGNGYALKLFTDEGESTVDPAKARRFFVQEMGAMVNLDETESTREIRVSVNQNTEVSRLKPTLEQLKNLASLFQA